MDFSSIIFIQYSFGQSVMLAGEFWVVKFTHLKIPKAEKRYFRYINRAGGKEPLFLSNGGRESQRYIRFTRMP